MDSQAIERRIRLGEDSRTELKSAQRGELSVKTLGKTIAAFANGRGGQILIGVEDDGTVTGIESPKRADELMRQVVQASQSIVDPALWCSVERAEVSGKLILVVDVPPFSPSRPHRAEHVYYVRDASMTREATRDELVRMLQSHANHYDELPVDEASYGDLDIDAVLRFLRAHYDAGAAQQPKHYLQALGCLTRDEVPTVTGILMFTREPARWLPDARISAVQFDQPTMSSTIADRQEIGGPLLEQAEAAFTFLKRHVPAPSEIRGMVRVEHRIPDVVLREAVVNALAHRDYRATSQTRIFVFSDRVEVINPGVLLNQLTLDGIRIGGISQRRNPIVAALLARAARRENLGIGVPEMFREMRDRGLAEPEIDLAGGHFRLTLRWQATEKAK